MHFGVIFLANIEMGFLCPPAGMNIYFASAMFGKSIRYVAVSVLPPCWPCCSGADHFRAAFPGHLAARFVRAGRRFSQRTPKRALSRRRISVSGNTSNSVTTLRTPAVLRAMSTAALASRSLTMPIRNNTPFSLTGDVVADTWSVSSRRA